jgi:trehalose 6-phosphate synthase/phosphatase
VPRTIIVANRLPVTVRVRDGWPQLVPSAGGLVSGLRGVHQQSESIWIGWPGDTSALSPDETTRLAASLERDRIVPVPLPASQAEAFYEGFSNGVLWPLFHYQLDRLPADARHWEAYRSVNERFADIAAAHYRPGDMIWVHDYQLMLVPQFLRERLRDARIGFFLHIPFPSYEVFRTLPWRRELLAGVLGADLVGMHTFSYVRYFAHAVQHLLGADANVDRITVGDRSVRVGAFPLGIDARRFADLAVDPRVEAEVSALRAGVQGRRIVLGVDRLDYTKGIPRRLLAFERLLERQPDLAGEVRLVQVAVPSRGGARAYRKFRRELDELVGRLNARFGDTDSLPIHYLHRSISPYQLSALYRAADVMLVTALRDGMNLVAKEFVASRVDDDGVLVLSEFAGAAEELGEALLINPYDIDAVADAILQALDMPAAERRARMRALRRRVTARTAGRWAEVFLGTLVRQTPPARDTADTDSPQRLRQRLTLITHPVLLLDYDGTLVPLATLPDLARPDAALIERVRELTRLMQVHVVSGRRREDLDEWLGDLDVTLWAEHGAWRRAPGAREWEAAEIDTTTWLPGIRALLEEFAACTPGAVVEEKSVSIAWHYRAADPEFGERQARELRLLLMDALRNEPADILQGSKVIEVRPRGVHKGRVVDRILREIRDPGRIVAIGDDRTDEEMFAAVPPDGVTVHVGPGPSRAAYRLANSAAVRDLLSLLARLVQPA